MAAFESSGLTSDKSLFGNAAVAAVSMLIFFVKLALDVSVFPPLFWDGRGSK